MLDVQTGELPSYPSYSAMEALPDFSWRVASEGQGESA